MAGISARGALESVAQGRSRVATGNSRGSRLTTNGTAAAAATLQNGLNEIAAWTTAICVNRTTVRAHRSSRE